MSSEHSPGPWTLTPDSFVMSGRKPSVGVARIICHAKEFPENGRLIAAAPDLLEALAYCADWIEDLIKASAHCGDSDYECPLQDCHKPGDLAGVLAKARAAQAKAAGR